MKLIKNNTTFYRGNILFPRGIKSVYGLLLQDNIWFIEFNKDNKTNYTIQ